MENKAFTCGKCQKIFSRKYIRDRHLATVHGEACHACDVCSKTFKRKDALTEHRRFHEDGFVCQFCEKSFTLKSNKKRHEERVHLSVGDVKFVKEFASTCGICQKTFSRKDTRDRHVTTVHEGEARYCYDVCSKTFKRKDDLKQHEQFHKDGFVCQFCEKSFTSKSKKKRHEESVHLTAGDVKSVKELTCGICQKAFSRKYIRDRHVATVHGEACHACDVCSKTFKRKDDLKQHQQFHKDGFICQFCNKSFMSKASKDRHEETAHLITGDIKKFRCDFCPKSFTRKEKLLEHEKKYHDPPYTCSTCGAEFVQHRLLSRHCIAVHKTLEERQDASEISPEVSNSRQDAKTRITDMDPIDFQDAEMGLDKPHDDENIEEQSSNSNHHKSTKDLQFINKPSKRVLCDRCGKFFSKSHFVGVHVRGHEGRKQYKCDLCDKSFIQKQSLDRHHVVHTGEKLFSCDICGNSFGQRVSLYRHKKNVHQKEEGVVCDICNKTFQTDESLKNHKDVTHQVKVQPEKQYVCKVCGRIYLTRCSLYVHIRVKHGTKKLLACKICGKTYHKSWYLKRHMALHEGIKFNSTKPKNYQCSQCKKVFEFMIRLTNHRRICSLNRYKCDVCKRTFPKACLLKMHLTRIHLNISKETDDVERCYLGMEDGIWPDDKQEPLDVQLRDQDGRTDENSSTMSPENSNQQTDQNVSLQSTAKFVTHNTIQATRQPLLGRNTETLNTDVHKSDNVNVTPVITTDMTQPTHYRKPDINVTPVITTDLTQSTHYRDPDINSTNSSVTIKSTEDNSVQRNNKNSESRSLYMVTSNPNCQNEYRMRQCDTSLVCQIKDEITTSNTNFVNHKNLDVRNEILSDKMINRNSKSTFEIRVRHEDFDNLNDSDELDQILLDKIMNPKCQSLTETCIGQENYDELDDFDEIGLKLNCLTERSESRYNRIKVCEEKHKMTRRSRTYVNYEECDYFDELDDFSL